MKRLIIDYLIVFALVAFPFLFSTIYSFAMFKFKGIKPNKIYLGTPETVVFILSWTGAFAYAMVRLIEVTAGDKFL